uniref:Predicted protein n=1 Tax=Hordeum vulgare subsp. vulgare TaxID=112509 RepID=F2DUG7_HORVV|nr:predicted protein [Hordeum vulgare subsp. vulgare]
MKELLDDISNQKGKRFEKNVFIGEIIAKGISDKHSKYTLNCIHENSY